MTRLKLVTGISLACQHWGSGPNYVLCLHGWLDNSNSFAYLGPYLEKKGIYTVVASDHVGHGRSDHNGLGSLNQFSAYVTHVKGLLDVLGWDKVDIIGHSLGAAVGMIFASCFPEKVKHLVLIDGFGPITKPASTSRLVISKYFKTVMITIRQFLYQRFFEKCH
jgi:pimeloyl-ACP methyl ester carboxylesterase